MAKIFVRLQSKERKRGEVKPILAANVSQRKQWINYAKQSSHLPAQVQVLK